MRTSGHDHKLALPENRQLDPIEACEKILAGMPNPPKIVHGGDKAFYSPMTDRITMPPRRLFENADEHWSTFWHEAAHASRHRKGLNRESINEVALLDQQFTAKRRFWRT
jgi:antirestriction protein ArdC